MLDYGTIFGAILIAVCLGMLLVLVIMKLYVSEFQQQQERER